MQVSNVFGTKFHYEIAVESVGCWQRQSVYSYANGSRY